MLSSMLTPLHKGTDGSFLPVSSCAAHLNSVAKIVWSPNGQRGRSRLRLPFTSTAKTLGPDTIQTLQFTTSAATFSVGQNFMPTAPWPRVTVQALHRVN